MAGSSAFTRREWRIVCASVLGVTLLVAAAGRELARGSAQADFDARSATTLRTVGERVVEMRGVMKSMLGMHYASDEFAGADIGAFAEQLRAYSPFVGGIGLFGVVDGALRTDYERYVSERDGVDFTIHGWNPEGRTLPASDRERYLPISQIDPMDGPGIDFLGTDLGTVDAIETAFGRAALSGEGFVVPMPASWPIAGDALLLQPVYASAQPPATADERREYLVGGIWVAMSLPLMFVDGFAAQPDAAVRLTAHVDGAPDAPVHAAPPSSATPGVDLGFADASVERRWHVGESALSARVDAALRASERDIASTAFAALLSALLGATAAGVLYQQRVVRRERHDNLYAMAAEREKAERTLESISDAVLTFDADGSCAYVNRAASERFGLDPGDVVGSPLRSALRIESSEAVPAPLSLDALVGSVEEAGTGGRIELDVRMRDAHGATATFALTLSRMAASAAADTGFILVLQDVSREREFTATLEHRAHHDSLTGCYNRFYFEHRLHQLVEDPAALTRQHALCYIDLDQFKIVNDTCGHEAGDRLLCELTGALAKRLRSSDVLARLGGDEFGVIVCDCSPTDARRVAEGLLEHFQTAMFEHEGNAFPVRGSIGLVTIDATNLDVGRILKAADLACYAAKDGGRNALVVYSEDDESMAQRREEMNWLPVLERALAHDGFALLVQPIVAVSEAVAASDDPVASHYEVLLRLLDEDGGEITPHRFIRAAERYDLMRAIDRWVVSRSFALVAAAPTARDTTFSINLSGQSAADPELLAFIADELARHGLEPSRFWFEITETAAITHFSTAVALIEGVHELGAHVALDDFGSGLSSFGYLRDLPVDVLKIDGQFVRDIASDAVAREMVRAMVHVARAMELRTVAEFVESAAVVDELHALGIDYAQGWHLGRPRRFEAVFDGAAVTPGVLDRAA